MTVLTNFKHRIMDWLGYRPVYIWTTYCPQEDILTKSHHQLAAEYPVSKTEILWVKKEKHQPISYGVGCRRFRRPRNKE